jgi:two-component system, LuxR family, response regulator FixJ
MTAIEPRVFVVDDDPAMRRSMLALLSAQGIRAETYPSGREFLAAFDPRRPGCVLLDLLLRGESGMDVLDELRSRPLHPPVIVLTAHGSVPASVQGLRAGAFDFIEKPMRPATLLARIREAFEVDARERLASDQRSVVEERARRLSAREREVARLLMTGKRSKEIAGALGISVRTVEGYRAPLLEKMQAQSAAHLVTMLLANGVKLRP